MGDRGDIVILPPGADPSEGETAIGAEILYTHWGGSKMIMTLHEALQELGLQKARSPKALSASTRPISAAATPPPIRRVWVETPVDGGGEATVEPGAILQPGPAGRSRWSWVPWSGSWDP